MYQNDNLTEDQSVKSHEEIESDLTTNLEKSDGTSLTELQGIILDNKNVKLKKNRYEETKIIPKVEKDDKEVCQNELLSKHFRKKKKEKYYTVIDPTEDCYTISKKDEKLNVQREREKTSHREKEESSNKGCTDNIRAEDKNESQYPFSIGKHLNTFLRWAVRASFSHEMSSSHNYLHGLSKNLTK